MNKVFTTILIIAMMISISCVCANSVDNYDLSLLKNCKYLYTDNNSSGSYIYGYNQNTLYSARLLPEVNIRYVCCNGFIRSVCQNGINCYALFEGDLKENKYVLVEMNMSSGNCNYYTFTDMRSFDDSSIAVSKNEVFFMFTDSNYTYVRSYSFSGAKLYEYKFNNEVTELFVNNSSVYTRLYNGDIYNLSNGVYSFCAVTKTQSDFGNAGKDYIFTDYGKLISLKDSTVHSGINSFINCVVYDRSIYSSNGNTVSTNDNFYTFDNEILILLVNDDKLAVLLKDYSCKTIIKSEMNDYKSDFTLNSTNIPYTIVDDMICAVESGTTVSKFKNMFSEDIKLYNTDGDIVTSGHIKTGYRTVLAGTTYSISVRGDITGEGNVKSNDISALMSAFTQKSQISGVYYKSADFDLNGEVNNKDLVLIAQKYETEK